MPVLFSSTGYRESVISSELSLIDGNVLRSLVRGDVSGVLEYSNGLSVYFSEI